MEFEESLISDAIGSNIKDCLAYSSPRAFPHDVMNFDDFLKNLTMHHSPSIDSVLSAAIENRHEPIFNVVDVEVQISTNDVDVSVETGVERDHSPSMGR
ncbi:hypothetical protein [Vibrio anguillarum]|uniref:Uncharacterized protein n=1 Tax=Vibrio anguillarum TaxID=55601 RepID=A0ABR9Z7I1_VIBAN|nr:hypothetical protein [Vibrio anguillarum]MBF4374348.1 hypothetical protein [Vibrio anguillarum]